MAEREVEPELSELDKELAGVVRRTQYRIDPSPRTGLVLTVSMLVLMGSLLLPWAGSATGWGVLIGVDRIGPLPRLFTFTSLGFGLVGSALTLGTRRWGLAWLTAFGCGFSVVHGVWSIWSLQSTAFEDVVAPPPGPGMIVAVSTMLVLAVSWVRIVLSR